MPPTFTYRAFTLAKDPEQPAEFQDAWRCAPDCGVAVVADGVSSAIFSGVWADVLVEAVAADRPPVDDRDALAAWLAARRQQWQTSIDTTGLAWFQKAKLRTGAFSTLLWLSVDSDGPPYAWHSRAIGDSCLFHVRRGELLRVFPIQKSEEFDVDPVVLGSIDLGRDHLIEFAAAEGTCDDGDLLVLSTDAVAQWILTQVEADNPPAWNDFWTMTDVEWRDGLERLRSQGLMRYDDATLVVLQIGVPAPAEEAPREPAAADRPVEVSDVHGGIAVQPGARPEDRSAAQPADRPQCEPVTEQPPSARAVETIAAAEATNEAHARPAEPPSAPIILPESSLAEKLKKTGDELAHGIEDAAEQVSTGVSRLAKGLSRFYRKYIRPDKQED